MHATCRASLSIVSYAVNGSGLGHVARQVAIHRWLRRYAALRSGSHTQHWFLTTSEADTWLWHEGFAAFKLPSKSVVEAAGVAQARLPRARQAVDLALAGAAAARPADRRHVPQRLVPRAARRARPVQASKALVLRPGQGRSIAQQAAFRAVAGLYDRVIVPASADEGVAELGLDPRRVAFTGPIMRAERFELRPRAEARQALGVPEGARCVLVSAGGGGDAGAEQLFQRTGELLADDPSLHLVLAAGPLFRGTPRRGPRLTWWTEPGLGEQLLGVDAAICAAGFNTAHELLFAGVPTVFLPQTKIADDQAARVEALVRAGAARVASLDDPVGLRAAISAVLEPGTAALLRAAGMAHVPENHARDAAIELLGLVLPTALLRQAREVVDDAALTELRALGVELGVAVDLACALHIGRAAVDRAALELDAALELLRTAETHAVPPATLLRVAGLWTRKLRSPRAAPPDAVAEALTLLLEFPGLAGQWSAAPLLLGALTGEREWGPVELATQLCALLDVGLSAGRDVFATTRALVEAQHELGGQGEGSSNAGLLARARARLRAGVG
jgi:UDP-N-acetylglucosamine--N-acetylmuramyl-(pentapeptide) pyrophosphoryl-undecaprenol N-acetylglucosamine transferase